MGGRGGPDGRDVGLPVEVHGPPHVVTQVSAFVESTLGWQVTDGVGLPALVRLVAVGHAGTGGRTGGNLASPEADVPTVLLVGPDDDPVTAAARGRAADVVVAWPGAHHELADAVADVLGRAPDVPDVRNVLRVAGAAGGVGTSTVALALGAWLAWDGSPAMVVVAGAAPVPDLPVVTPDVVAGHRVWAAARPVPDVPGLRVVASTGPVDDVAAPRGIRVVVDDGPVRPGVDRPDGSSGRPGAVRGAAATGPSPSEPDVVVVRRDRAGADAIVDHPGSTIVLVDRGPRPRGELTSLAGAREVVVVAHSARVRRAHERRAVPGSMPGTVLTSLRRVLSLVEPRTGSERADPGSGA